MKYLLVETYERHCKKCLEWERHFSCEDLNSWVYESVDKKYKLLHPDEVRSIVQIDDIAPMFLINDDTYVKLFKGKKDSKLFLLKEMQTLLEVEEFING